MTRSEERESISESDLPSVGGGELTEQEHEVTLHEERPVVQKEQIETDQTGPQHRR
jgi:hypothetical protein